MIIKNVTDVNRFYEVIDQCVGRVELSTERGDRMNLKSKLSQIVSLTKIYNKPHIDEIEVHMTEQEDIDRLINYMVYR